jgi:pimeloyl-ACP methyl ester carboxylesterase
MPETTVNGARLHYEQRGPEGAPALLFHHGYMSAGDSWTGVIDGLVERHRCVALDARGCGESERTADGHSVEQYGADALALADSLGIERVTFVGHSMGGAVGLWLALAEPSRVERLVLVSSVPAGGVGDEAAARAPGAHPRDASRRRGGAAGGGASCAGRAPALGRRPRALRAALARRLRRPCGGDGRGDAHAAALRSARRAHPADPRGRRRCRRAVPSNLADYARIPNATLHFFSRVSHGMPAEVPVELAAELADLVEHGAVTMGTLLARLEAMAAGTSS